MVDNCVFVNTSAYTKKCFRTIGPNNRKNFRFSVIEAHILKLIIMLQSHRYNKLRENFYCTRMHNFIILYFSFIIVLFNNKSVFIYYN